MHFRDIPENRTASERQHLGDRGVLAVSFVREFDRVLDRHALEFTPSARVVSDCECKRQQNRRVVCLFCLAMKLRLGLRAGAILGFFAPSRTIHLRR